MKLLADENLDAAIVAWLRQEGEDVLSAAESHASAEDARLLHQAWQEGRCIITNDRDFGELAIRHGGDSHGIVLLRFSPTERLAAIARFKDVWQQVRGELIGHMIVITDTKLRRRPLLER